MRDKTECANSGLKIGTVYNCNTCGNYEYQTLFEKVDGKDRPRPAKLLVSGSTCSVCSEPYFINGPIWTASLNNHTFIEKMMTSVKAYQ